MIMLKCTLQTRRWIETTLEAVYISVLYQLDNFRSGVCIHYESGGGYASVTNLFRICFVFFHIGFVFVSTTLNRFECRRTDSSGGARLWNNRHQIWSNLFKTETGIHIFQLSISIAIHLNNVMHFKDSNLNNDHYSISNISMCMRNEVQRQLTSIYSNSVLTILMKWVTGWHVSLCPHVFLNQHHLIMLFVTWHWNKIKCDYGRFDHLTLGSPMEITL